MGSDLAEKWDNSEWSFGWGASMSSFPSPPPLPSSSNMLNRKYNLALEVFH